MRSARRLALTVAAAAAALVAPAIASADDCGLEGTYFSGRGALGVAGDAATLGTFAAGSEATNVLRTWAFGRGAPTTVALTTRADAISTPAFVTRPDGRPEAIVGVSRGGATVGIVGLWVGDDGRRVEQLLVGGVGYGSLGNDVIGAAMAPDGTLTIAYVLDQYAKAGPSVQIARIAPDGAQQVATTRLAGFTPTVGIASDGAAYVVVGGAASALRWAPGAPEPEPVALPGKLAGPADDDVPQSDAHGGLWLRLGFRLLHLGPGAAAYAGGDLARTTVVVDADGNAIFGHGAKVRTVAPSGATLSDRKATGTVAGAGTVNVEAVALRPRAAPGARPAVLLSQTRRAHRTLTFVRADGTRATIAAKARNFTTDAQAAVLADGSAWVLWEDAHRTYDQNCNIDTVDDVSVQAVRITPHARRPAPKALAAAPMTVASGG